MAKVNYLGRTDMPRGYRNNNPLNIRFTEAKWQGKVCASQNTDKGRAFEQFKDMYYGWRAALIVLRTYSVKYDRHSIREIITRWAPEGDGNDPEGYIRRVGELTGLDVNYPLDFTYRPHVLPLLRAMATVENGVAPTEDMKEAMLEAWQNYFSVGGGGLTK